jgi:hypothetical protein
MMQDYHAITRSLDAEKSPKRLLRSATHRFGSTTPVAGSRWTGTQPHRIVHAHNDRIALTGR